MVAAPLTIRVVTLTITVETRGPTSTSHLPFTSSAVRVQEPADKTADIAKSALLGETTMAIAGSSDNPPQDRESLSSLVKRLTLVLEQLSAQGQRKTINDALNRISMLIHRVSGPRPILYRILSFSGLFNNEESVLLLVYRCRCTELCQIRWSRQVPFSLL